MSDKEGIGVVQVAPWLDKPRRIPRQIKESKKRDVRRECETIDHRKTKPKNEQRNMRTSDNEFSGATGSTSERKAAKH